MRKLFLNGFLLGIFSFFVISAIGCEGESLSKGLGAAVDTELPTVEITYPDYDVVIRDSFYVVGDCRDDTVVESVKVWITNSRNPDITGGPFLATLSKKKIDSARDTRTWYVLLNEEKTDGGGYGYGKKWTYPDGNYIVKAIAYDKTGQKSSEATHTYVIDNTAPFMILKSPGVDAKQSVPAIGATEGKTPTPYGANLKVEGIIIENNNIETMEVDVFKSTPKADIDAENLESLLPEPLVFNNINFAGSASELIASARIGSGENLFENYKKIYESGSGNSVASSGSKNRYCKVTLYDRARAYKDTSGKNAPKGDDEIGNHTDNVFINDLIYSELQSGASGYGLIPEEIAQVLNDTYNIEKSDATEITDRNRFIEANKQAIKDIANGTISNLTAFSIDPDANPKYSISGYSVDADTQVGDNISMVIAGQSINATVIAGRDNYYIKPETLTYYLFGPYKVYPKNEMEKIYEDPAAYYKDSENAEYIVPNDAEFTNEKKNSSYNSSTVQSYNWELKLPAAIKADHFYVVALTGEDEEKLPVFNSSNKYYVLKGSNNIAPPNVTFTETNGATYGTTDLTFHGTAMSPSAVEIKDVYWKATLVDYETGRKVSEVVIDAQGKGKSVTTKTQINAGSNSSFNWELSLKDSWPDYNTIKAEGEDGKTYGLELTIWAEDENGKQSALLSKSFDIDTTRPTFVCSDFGIDSNLKPNYVGPSNIQYQNGIYTLRGTVSDDKSGVLAFYYKVDNEIDATVLLPEITRKTDGSVLDAAPDISVSGWIKSDGRAKVEKEITDIGDFVAKTISVFCIDKVGNRSELEKYSIVFDGLSPKVEIKTPRVSYTNELDSVVAEVVCNDLGTIANLNEDVNLSEVVLYNGDTPIATYGVDGTTDTLIVSNSSGKNTVSYTIPSAQLSEGTYEFKVIAKNKAGSAASSDVSKVMYDKTKPIIESDTIRVETKDPDENYFNAKSLTIKADYTETGSGIDKIKYTVIPSINSGASPKTGDFSAVDGSFSIILGGFALGENILELVPVDRAGNEGVPVTKTIKVDLIFPTVSDVARIFDDDTIQSIGTSLLTNGKQPIKVMGYAIDDIGIKSISLSIDGNLVKSITKDDTANFIDKSSSLPPQAEGNNVKIEWTVDIPPSFLSGQDGKEVSVDIIDNAGNLASQAICSLLVDEQSPECTFSTSTTELNGTREIRGTSTDDKSMVSMELYYTKKSNLGIGTGQAAIEAVTTEKKNPADYGWIRVRKNMASAVEDYVYTKTSDIYNWKFLNFPFDLETSGAPSTGTNAGIAEMYFLPVVIDEAGNSNAYEVTYDPATKKNDIQLDIQGCGDGVQYRLECGQAVG